VAKKAPKTLVVKPLKTVSDLVADPQNANRGTARGRAVLETSVRRYGFGRSVLADKYGRVIAGNKTVEAATSIGQNPDVIVVESTGDQLVVVQRTDLDLDDPRAKELAVADNRTAELGLDWNTQELQRMEEDGGADLKQFWRVEEWEKLIAAATAAGPPPEEVPGMALQPFEEYNYLMVVCKNSQDWQGLCDQLHIVKESVVLGGARKVGLGRVISGERLLEALCKSSSLPGNGSTSSARTRSPSSRARPSASPKAKRTPTEP